MRKEEPKGKEKEAILNPRKRRGSLLGPEMGFTPDDQSMMPDIHGAQSSIFNQHDVSANHCPADTSAADNTLVAQVSDISTRPICKMKARLASDTEVKYPSVSYDNGGEGSSRNPSVYDNNGYQQQSGVSQVQGYNHPQEDWTGYQASYDDEFSDEYSDEQDMQQQGYNSAYSGDPSEAYDLNSQRHQSDHESTTFTWSEVAKLVQDSIADTAATKNDEIFFLRQQAASNLEEQRQIDKEEHLGILSEKDDTINKIQAAYLELEASIPAQLLEREHATRSICETQYETRRQGWLNTVGTKDARIQELEGQLRQLANAPPPQARIEIEEDPQLAALQAETTTYEAEDVNKVQKEAGYKLKAKKAADDLKKALELIRTLTEEKAELESSKKNLEESVEKLTTEKQELTQKLERSDSVVVSFQDKNSLAQGNVSARERQIHDTHANSPDMEVRLHEIVDEIKTPKESADDFTNLRMKLRKSEDKIKSLKPEARNLPDITNTLETSKQKISCLETSAITTQDFQVNDQKLSVLEPTAMTSNHFQLNMGIFTVPQAASRKPIRRTPRLSHLRAIHGPSNTPLSQQPLPTKTSHDVPVTAVKTPSRPSLVVAAEKDQPRRLICNLQLTRENTDLKDANSQLSKEIRKTEEQKANAEASLSSVTAKFHAQGQELLRVAKIKDIMARLLVLGSVFLLFTFLCIPHQISNPPNPGQQKNASIIGVSPPRTEFEDIYPEYIYGIPDGGENNAESIRVSEIYQEYLAVMNDRASRRTFPNPTISYPEQPSPAQKHNIYDVPPMEEKYPIAPLSFAEPSTRLDKSGFQVCLEELAKIIFACLIICGFFGSIGLVIEVQNWIERCKERMADMKSCRLAQVQRIELGLEG
ncbi:hypothetical protein ONS96_011631 [Cadophora gregata f. sp. sojae]|nr:hypothetical protein ONS96_011631 [Cadophora gregata f. sp. sojae]